MNEILILDPAPCDDTTAHRRMRWTIRFAVACMVMLIAVAVLGGVSYHKAVAERHDRRAAECQIIKANRAAVLRLAHDLFIPIVPAANAEDGLLQQIQELNALYATQHKEIKKMLDPFTCDRIVP